MGHGGSRPGAGRKAGSPNAITTELKEAILQAADKAGGAAGIVGYLQTQADKNPGPFLSLLGKVLPMTIGGADGGPVVVEIKRFAG